MSEWSAVTPERLLGRAREVLRIEAEAVARLAERVDASFADACRLILACTGRVVVSGIGKSGHVARKVAATLASTGTPAFFVHPAEVFVDDPDAIFEKRVLVVEDGPTLTHGEMAYGAGYVAARRFGAKEIVDPRPFAVGSIAKTFEKYPKTGPILPAMGYGEKQTKELEETINKSDADLVVIGTPIDLSRVVKINKPSQRVRYELQEIGAPALKDVLMKKFGVRK